MQVDQDLLSIVMETRVHKLLILAGEEGADLEARDFKKLSEVIVNEYLSQPNPSFRNFLIEIITKVVRGIPLKSHLYAGLTVAIAKGYPQLAGKILENVVGTLQTDLTAGKFSQTLNSLNYLSETMNVSFLNSLNYMNLLQDLLQAAERQTECVLQNALLSLLVKALPLCASSLYEKTHHELKKFMQKMSKLVNDDELFFYLFNKFSKGSLPNYSAMDRLAFDFTGVNQHNGKLRLLIDLKSARGKELHYNGDLYRWDWKSSDLEYEAYRKGQGLIIRLWIQQLIQTFSENFSILLLKFLNLVKTKSENPYEVKFITECLLLRGLRSKNPMAEYSLLTALRNSEQLPKFSGIVEEFLFEFFNSAETFELSLLVSFAKLFTFIVNNSKEDIDWSKYADQQDMFLKRAALLRLILEKMSLLNDKFKCPASLAAFENSKPFTSEQQFINSSDQDTFDKFDKAIKQKIQAPTVMAMITSEREYEIFLEALFRRTSLSQTHLNILSQRYNTILTKFSQWDWDLINKIRNFFRNSFFHRLLYLRFMIAQKYLSFSSYINYVGQLKNKSDIDMTWIKMQLNELNSEFGKSLKSSK